MTRSSRSLRTHRQRRFRAVNFESLELRQLLAVEILSAAYKTLDFTATGTLTGQTRGDIQTANDYHDDYTANLSFSGAVLYSSPTQGSGSGIGQGNGSGTENCPPEFGVLDTYAYSFDSDISIGQSGTVLEIDQTTTRFEYSNSTCTGDYSVGATPFDRAISGPLNISTMPYTAVLNFTDASSTPYPNRSQGSVNLTVTPHDDEAFNLVVDALEEDSAGILVSFASAGPTTTATAPNAAITNVQLYFASGPTPQEIIGDSLANLPVYWNSASGSMRVTDLPEAPSGASHLVAIVDRAGLLNESSEADNFLSLVLTPYQNPLNRYWVNLGDQDISALDYNIIVNEINANGVRVLAPPTGPVTAYWDVTGDNVLAPDDAQQVATYINAFGVTTGAGEPISQREDAAARPTALVMPVAPLAAGLFAPDFTISHTAVETKAPANESPVDVILAAGPSTSDEALIDARASELSDGYWRDGVRRRADVTAALLWNGEENADWWLS
jgi:hypothetical protein